MGLLKSRVSTQIDEEEVGIIALQDDPLNEWIR
jgi:hypothetical protein